MCFNAPVYNIYRQQRHQLETPSESLVDANRPCIAAEGSDEPEARFTKKNHSEL